MNHRGPIAARGISSKRMATAATANICKLQKVLNHKILLTRQGLGS